MTAPLAVIGAGQAGLATAYAGRPFPGDGDRYPAREEVAAYLRAYAYHLHTVT